MSALTAFTLFALIAFLSAVSAQTTTWFYCSVQYGNPSGYAAGAQWTLTHSGFLQTSAVVTSGNRYQLPVVALNGTRTFYDAVNNNNVVTAITSLASGTTPNIYYLISSTYQNTDPRELDTTGITFSLQSAATQPVSSSTATSSITLHWSAAANQYVESGAEAPLYSSFQIFPVTTAQEFPPGYGSYTYPTSKSYPPCQALSSSAAAIAADTTYATTQAWGFCYLITAPQGAVPQWQSYASGIITTLATPSIDAGESSTHMVRRMTNVVGTRTHSIVGSSGSSYVSNIIGLEQDFFGLADGGPDNQIYLNDTTNIWYESSTSSLASFLYGPTLLDGNGFTYNIYPPGPIEGSPYQNAPFSTYNVTDVNFYWNRNYREVNEPNHQDPEGYGMFLLVPYTGVSTIPTCTQQLQTWQFCYTLWGNPSGANGGWAVTMSGVFTTQTQWTVQSVTASVDGLMGLNPTPAYRLLNMNGTRTFTSSSGAVSTSTISQFYGYRNYGFNQFQGVPPSGTDHDLSPIMLIYSHNADGRVVDQTGFTFNLSTPAQVPIVGSATPATSNRLIIYWNNAAQQYSEFIPTNAGVAEAPMLSSFQYWPILSTVDDNHGQPWFYPTCAAFTNTQVKVWSYCYVLNGPATGWPWFSQSYGLFVTAANNATDTGLFGGPNSGLPYFPVENWAGIRNFTDLQYGNAPFTSSIIALQSLQQARSLHYNYDPVNNQLPDGGTDNYFFPAASNYNGGVMLDGNGVAYNMYPPSPEAGYYTTSGSTGAPLLWSDINFYYNGNYREVNEPDHQADNGVGSLTVVPYTQGQPLQQCTAKLVLPSPANYSFCAVLYARANSTAGAWSVSYNGWFQTAPLPVTPFAAVPVYPITSVSATRTYISAGTAATASVSINTAASAGATNYLYLYTHINTSPLLSSNPLDAAGIQLAVSTASHIPGLQAAYSTITLAMSGANFIEVGTTGSGSLNGETPGYSSFSYQPYTVGNILPACAAVTTPSANVAVFSFCYSLSSHPFDTSGPWVVQASGLIIVNSTTYVDTANSPPLGLVYAITGVAGVRTYTTYNSANQVVSQSSSQITGVQQLAGGDGGPDNELFASIYPAQSGNTGLVDFDGFTINLSPPAQVGGSAGNNGYPLFGSYGTLVTDVEFYWGGTNISGQGVALPTGYPSSYYAGNYYREVNEPYHQLNDFTSAAGNNFTYVPYAGTGIGSVLTCPAKINQPIAANPAGTSTGSGVTYSLGCNVNANNAPAGSVGEVIVLNVLIPSLAPLSTSFASSFATAVAAAVGQVGTGASLVACNGVIDANGNEGNSANLSSGQSQVSYQLLNYNGVNTAPSSLTFNVTSFNSVFAASTGINNVASTSPTCTSGCANSGGGGGSGLSHGAIAGIVIGVVFGVIILCIILYCCCFALASREKSAPPPATTEVSHNTVAGAYDAQRDDSRNQVEMTTAL